MAAFTAELISRRVLSLALRANPKKLFPALPAKFPGIRIFGLTGWALHFFLQKATSGYKRDSFTSTGETGRAGRCEGVVFGMW